MHGHFFRPLKFFIGVLSTVGVVIPPLGLIS
jgi:hypothetical protein